MLGFKAGKNRLNYEYSTKSSELRAETQRQNSLLGNYGREKLKLTGYKQGK
jgi:hypothetical protein